MIIQQSFNTNIIGYCNIYFGPNESRSYINDGIGSTHSHIYISSGSGKFTFTPDGEPSNILDSYDVKAGELIDVRSTVGHLQLVDASAEGLAVMAFNPILFDRDNLKYTVEVIKGSETKTVACDWGKRFVIICIDGKITINDKELTALQYASVFPGKTADITIPENSVIGIVSTTIELETSAALE